MHGRKPPQDGCYGFTLTAPSGSPARNHGLEDSIQVAKEQLLASWRRWQLYRLGCRIAQKTDGLFLTDLLRQAVNSQMSLLSCPVLDQKRESAAPNRTSESGALRTQAPSG